MANSRERLFVLNDPHAMRVSPELASEIGFNEHLVFLQLEFLVSISTYGREGKRWTRQTLQDLKDEYFPFWSMATINRAIDNLIAQKLIVVRNFNQKTYDRTRWFALNLTQINKLNSVTISQNEKGSAENANSQPPDQDVCDDNTLPIFHNEKWETTNDLAEREMAPVGAPSVEGTTPAISQDEKSNRANREMDFSNRAVRTSQNETAIPETTNLKPSSGGDASVADVDDSKSRSEPTAQTILTAALEAGIAYSPRFKAHLGREIKILLEAGIETPIVTEAAVRCVRGGKHPSVIHSIVNEVRADSTPGSRSTRGHAPFQTPSPDEYAEAVIR